MAQPMRRFSGEDLQAYLESGQAGQQDDNETARLSFARMIKEVSVAEPIEVDEDRLIGEALADFIFESDRAESAAAVADLESDNWQAEV